jgi:hypothetical protein
MFSSSTTGAFTITANTTSSGYINGRASVTVNASVVQSVPVSCNPTSILTTGTSICTAAVVGLGTVNQAVVWSASSGSIDNNGVLHPPSTSGVVTITATSVQGGIPGTGQVTVAVPASIKSISLTCSPALIAPTATSICTPTITGQGNYSSAVTWSQNIGQVDNNGIFTPSGVERATITATSVQDPSQSSSFVVDSDISWNPGNILWGADGSFGLGAYYWVPATTQIADLKRVFGATANTIMYRAWNYESVVASADLMQFQNAGVIPLVGFATYPSDYIFPATCGTSTQEPGWQSWYDNGGEAEAYRWTYCRALQAAHDLQTNLYWYIGNEWEGDNYSTLPSQCQNAAPVRSTSPTAWEKGNPCYVLFRGVLAGAIAGLRKGLGYVRIIPGMNGGNGNEGLAAALAADLADPTKNQSGTSLSWDFTSMHWGSDAVSNGNSLCGNAYFNEGPPDSYFYPPYTTYINCDPTAYNQTVNRNMYATVGAAGKPIIITEISSSDGQLPLNSDSANNSLSAMNDPIAADQIIGIFENMKAHAFAVNGEGGVVGGLFYQLYQQPFDNPAGITCTVTACRAAIDKFLYMYQAEANHATLSTLGTMIQAWIQNNKNPTVMTAPAFTLVAQTNSSTTVSNGGTVSANLTLTGASFTGSAVLSYRVWAIEPNPATVRPACTFTSLNLSVTGTSTIRCSVPTGAPTGTYVVGVYGTSDGSSASANFTFTVR